MGGAHLHTPQSIFQYMMSQHNTQQQQVGPWMQIPQVPRITIPWNASSTQQPELIKIAKDTCFGPILHQKRKLDVLDHMDMYRRKQFISEEKMTAHFKDLHISSNYQSKNPVPSTSTTDVSSFPQKRSNMDLDVDATNMINSEQEDDAHPRLVFSEELKRMKQEPILPSTLLSKLERPSMALVLWEPPNKHLRILPTRDTPTPIPSTSDDNNNNNLDVIPDLNHSTAFAFEPMEL